MRRYAHIHSLFSLVFFFHHHCVRSQLLPDQRATMENLYEILTKDSHKPSPLPWNLTKDPNPCSWRGVYCALNLNQTSSITQLSLSSLSLSNPNFLPILCQISTLESIDVSDNVLGLIPDEFMTDCGKLNGLRSLNFSQNRLSGKLPSFVGFQNLGKLDLSHNFLNQTIDLQLSGLISLKTLNLAFNQFSGFVPANLGKSFALEELDLSRNQFYGKIPEKIANYSNLVAIDLSENGLSGPIPENFKALSKLETFVISANNLTLEIPNFFSDIRALRRFIASENKFSGAIPPKFTNFLKNLDLSYNHLSGMIPNDLLSQPNLQTVDLSSNSLSGSVPKNMSPSLIRLRLANNSLSGEIPSLSFETLQNLTYLELENNNLTGSIPDELGMCKGLALLNLANNKLTGVLPHGLRNLVNVQEFKLQSNNLRGEIPRWITQLPMLRELNISGNSIDGSIPSSISDLQNLSSLDLSRNNLSGLIPDSISKLTFLVELHLGDNRLSGKIPLMPESLQFALNLSSNLFQGPIPVSLSKLQMLEVLDLSSNRLSGSIPRSLASMISLTTLNLSNNLLSGVKPQFPSHPLVDTSGNRDLKDAIVLHQGKKKTAAMIVISILGSFGLVAIIVILVAKRYYRTNEQQIQSEVELSEPTIVDGYLLTPNPLHRSNINFAKAMELANDPSNIILKTKFSTYYRALMPGNVIYLVKKLDWADKTFQLGIDERFREELKAISKLSNSYIMTPLAYMLTVDSVYLFYDFLPNGTLNDALHCGNPEEALDWGSRYHIAIRVAQGLAYLHGCGCGPILLFDLSSTSILLKSLKEPLIGDFELWKLIDPAKNTTSLSAVAGTVGYIPPEYAYTMRVTMAGNIYSFGVVLLELVMGRPAVSREVELAKRAPPDLSKKFGNLDHMLDSKISSASLAVRNQMRAVLKVALACVSNSPDARPNAKSVVAMLLNAR